MVVPVKLARYGLSELVNHLLDNEKPVPLDFLIDGQFLRTTVAKYMETAKVTAEQVLKVEYVLAMPQPETNEVDTNEDWISGVVAVDGEVISASYDGSLRFYRGEPLARYNVANVGGGAALKCVAAVRVGEILQVAVGTKDGKVILLRYKGDALLHEMVGAEHKDSVDCIAFNEDASLLASAGADGHVIVWNVEEPSVKRKRTNESLSLKWRLEEHTQQVSSLQWQGTTLLSAGHDMQVRAWDILSGGRIVAMPLTKAVTGLHMRNGEIITAHQDGKVHAWKTAELSQDSTMELTATLNAFKRVVTQLKWGAQDHLLAAVSHDGHLKLLDTRARIAMQSCHVEDAKLLCMDWLSSTTIVTGASDGKLRFHSFTMREATA